MVAWTEVTDMLATVLRIITYIPRLFSCEEYTRNLSAKLDGRIKAPGSFALTFHHIYCSFCRRFRVQLEIIERACKKLADEDRQGAPILMNSDVRNRIRSKLRE